MPQYFNVSWNFDKSIRKFPEVKGIIMILIDTVFTQYQFFVDE